MAAFIRIQSPSEVCDTMRPQCLHVVSGHSDEEGGCQQSPYFRLTRQLIFPVTGGRGQHYSHFGGNHLRIHFDFLQDWQLSKFDLKWMFSTSLVVSNHKFEYMSMCKVTKVTWLMCTALVIRFCSLRFGKLLRYAYTRIVINESVHRKKLLASRINSIP